MGKSFLSALLPLLLMGCDPSFGDDCTCTLAYCSQGGKVSLGSPPDTSRYPGLSVSLAYGDTIEAASQAWAFDKTQWWFTSPKLRKLKPARVAIRVAYRLDGTERTAAAEKDLAWKSYVCNRCSGSSPSCTDQMAHVAETALDTKALLSPP